MQFARGTPLLPFVLVIILGAGPTLLAESGLYILPLGANGARIIGVLSLVLLGLLVWFFRDPDREVGEGVVSAADGVVTAVEQTEEGARVNVFMSPLNVHVNRAPLAGKVVSLVHHDGGHLPAYNKDSERNERVVIEWDTAVGRLRTVQIAGAVARRIVPYVEPDEQLDKGARFGLIRLGSRLDHHLPAGCRLSVSVGDKVLAGETTIATFRGEP